MTKQQFIKMYYALACKAGEVFDLNPIVILAQSAIETGWGQSNLAVNHNNFFGITAAGRANEYWPGTSVTLGDYKLKFRTYPDPEKSFLDYARLIRASYHAAAEVSFHPEAFAHEMAYSKYISEVNGDNRENYRKMLVSISRSISILVEMNNN